MLFCGIDTSNYTTSVAVCDIDGNIVANLKRPLPVKDGERGLRQSDAVFAHVKNLPALMNELSALIADRSVCAVGVSSQPRNNEGSYMPCFLTGVAAAEAFCAGCAAPLYKFRISKGTLWRLIPRRARQGKKRTSFLPFTFRVELRRYLR